MSKKFTCYVGIYNSEIGYLLEDSDKNNKHYESFSHLIKDIDNINFKLDNSSDILLSEFQIIFQFEIEKKGSSDDDSFFNIEIKSEFETPSDESKKYIQELRKKLAFTDNLKYNICINGYIAHNKSAFMIFTFILNLFFIFLNSEDYNDFDNISWDSLLSSESVADLFGDYGNNMSLEEYAEELRAFSQQHSDTSNVQTLG